MSDDHGLDPCEMALADFTSVQQQYIDDMENENTPPGYYEIEKREKNKSKMKREFKNVIRECDTK